MDVTAKYELIGLMAYPIRHSLSPEMQNKALEKAGLPYTYMAFEVDNTTFASAIEGIKEIKLFNRKDDFFEKAVAFAKRVNENTDCVVTVTDLADQHAFTEALASADILTNGTKVGMKPLENESLIGDVSLLRPELLVTECVYNPHMTKLLQQAQQAGCKTIDGYGMLLWQGAEQFELWTGKAFPLDYVKQVMGFTA
ncbi:hypothetical protein ACEO7R_000135 [Salmonella enterica]|nr:hypothetical protein [Salmonella enterica]